MHIQISYTREDAYQAQKLNYLRSKSKYFVFVCGVLLLLWVAFNIFILNDFIIPNIFPIFGGLFLFFYPYTFIKYWTYWWFKRAPGLHNLVTMEIDENGISTMTQLSNGKIKFEGFNRFENNNKVLLLFTAPRVFLMVPKRFVSDEDWVQLLGYVSLKVPSRKVVVKK